MGMLKVLQVDRWSFWPDDGARRGVDGFKFYDHPSNFSQNHKPCSGSRGHSPTDLQSLLDSSHSIAVSRKFPYNPFSSCCVIQSVFQVRGRQIYQYCHQQRQTALVLMPLCSHIVKLLSAASFPKSQIHQITHEETQYTTPQGPFCYVWPKTLSDQTSKRTSSSLWFISLSDFESCWKDFNRLFVVGDPHHEIHCHI